MGYFRNELECTDPGRFSCAHARDRSCGITRGSLKRVLKGDSGIEGCRKKKCFVPYYNRLDRRPQFAGMAKWLSAWPTTRMLEGSIPSRTMKFLLFFVFALLLICDFFGNRIPCSRGVLLVY